MPRWIRGWKIGRHGYIVSAELDYERIKNYVKDVLSRARKGNVWRCRCGSIHIPLIVNNEIVGEIWEDVSLDKIEAGPYWYGRNCGKVHLVYNGRIIGFMWLPLELTEGMKG